jgi:Asp-tRNA(Asn)/Glu-tRNA(Gln) amidotransferase A subunit family amidase
VRQREHLRLAEPLHGIPIGLKDIYETAGVATTGHSKVMQDHVPQKDAESNGLSVKRPHGLS